MAAIAMSTTFGATLPPCLPPSLRHPYSPVYPITSPSIACQKPNILSLSPTKRTRRSSSFVTFSTNASANSKFSGSGGCGGDGSNSGGGSAGYRGGGYGNEWDDDMNKRNREEALTELAEVGVSLESLPKDLKAAVVEGRIPGPVTVTYRDLEKSKFFQWLIKSGGFKKKLLADDLFLAKVAIEFGGVGVTKTATEHESRRENFLEEIEIVISDEVMSLITDFILACLPAPTASLRANLAPSAGHFAKSLHVCPDNASQIALHGSLFSSLGSLFSSVGRFGARMRDGAKLFAVGIASPLVGTALTNPLMGTHNAVDHSAVYGLENVPVLSTSAVYGAYMGVSSNLRHQFEQWFPELLLHQPKLFLGATICFAEGTGPGPSLYQVLSGKMEHHLLEPLRRQREQYFSLVSLTVGSGNLFFGSLVWGILSLIV